MLYSDLDLAVLRLRFDRKDAARVVHRLDAVQHEVHQHLLDLHPVREAGKVTSKNPHGWKLHSHRSSTQHPDQD